MKDRKVIDRHNIEFKPFDRYGSPVPKMSWHIISYNQTSGQGSYVLKMEPGAQTVPHMHMGFEEFLMIEGELIDAVHRWADEGVDAVILNPAAYTHTSIALRDAIGSTTLPVVEVHISNIYKREEFRHTSYTAPVSVGVISGLGFYGYVAALNYLVTTLEA